MTVSSHGRGFLRDAGLPPTLCSSLRPHILPEIAPGFLVLGCGRRLIKLTLVSWLWSWRWPQKRQQTWLCLFQRGATSAFLPGVTAVYVAIRCFLTDGMYCKQRISKISLGLVTSRPGTRDQCTCALVPGRHDSGLFKLTKSRLAGATRRL